MSYLDWRNQFVKQAEEDELAEAPAEQTEQVAETDDTQTDDSSNEVIKMLCKILADE